MSAGGETTADRRIPTEEELFGELTAIGVVLEADGDRVRVRAPKNALSPELRQALELRREALRALVGQLYRSPAECVVARGQVRPPCRRMSPCAEPVDGRPCLVPATCCVCSALLSFGRRYLCEACAAAGAGR